MAMTMLGMTDLLDDFAHYAKVYETVTGCSEEKWVALAFNSTLIRGLESMTNRPDPLRVLSVGSGKGEIDCVILENLLPSFAHISNTVVEPSGAQLDLYRKLVEETGDALKAVSFNWRQETAEEYLDAVVGEGASQQSDKFHLVTAIHVLYYMKDLKGTIQKFYDMLEEGGVFFIVITSNDTTQGKVWSKMNEFQEDLRPVLLTECGVRSALDELGLPYVTERVPLSLRAAAVFDDSSAEGNSVLDFMAHTVDFRATAPAPLRDSILDLLRSPEILKEKENGEQCFISHWTHFTLKKIK